MLSKITFLTKFDLSNFSSLFCLIWSSATAISEEQWCARSSVPSTKTAYSGRTSTSNVVYVALSTQVWFVLNTPAEITPLRISPIKPSSLLFRQQRRYFCRLLHAFDLLFLGIICLALYSPLWFSWALCTKKYCTKSIRPTCSYYTRRLIILQPF